jgi:hypothetical protein
VPLVLGVAGATVFLALTDVHEIAPLVLIGTVAIAAALYILDMGHWHSCLMIRLRALLILALCGGFGTAAVMYFRAQPFLPLALFFILLPAYYALLRVTFWAHCHVVNYVHSVGAVLILGGAICLQTSLLWAAMNDFWPGDHTRLVFKQKLQDFHDPASSACLSRCSLLEDARAASCDTPTCWRDWTSPECLVFPGTRDPIKPTKWKEEPRYDLSHCQSEECQTEAINDPSYYCLPAFVLYQAQFIFSTATIAVGMFLTGLMSAVRRTERKPNDIHPVVKFTILLLFTSMIMLWVASSVGGSSSRVASLVQFFGVMIGVMSTLILFALMGRRDYYDLRGDMTKLPLFKSLEGLASGTFIKAVCVIFGFPIIPFALVVSFLNQLARRFLPCTKELANNQEAGFNEKELWLTKIGQKLLVQVSRWSWTQVIKSMVTFSTVVFVLKAFVPFVNYFMSYLNAQLSSAALEQVTGIFLAVGFLMFMLPPVPGGAVRRCSPPVPSPASTPK